jgi:hypothetical protein
MMSPREEALRYVSLGYPVLPCYTILIDDDGEKFCTCRNRLCWTAPRDSRGKHPRSDLVPEGVHGATTDPAVINSWPEDGWNIGIAGRDRWVFIDIDDSAIAKALLESEDVNKGLIICVTRRGCHIWIRTTEDTVNGIIKTRDGRKIGEMRAAGYYVIAPPSQHVAGRYSWFRNTPFDSEIPEWEGDGWSYISNLLHQLGVEVLPKSQTLSVVPSGKVSPADLPFPVPLEAVTLRQLISGTFPTNDRSAALYHLGCEIARVARSLGQPITAPEIAGAVAKTDQIMYQKFTGRSDANRRYFEIAVRALEEVDSAEESPVRPISGPTVVSGPQPVQAAGDILTVGDFSWDARLGQLIYNQPTQKGSRPVAMANFLPVIRESLTVWNGPDQEPRTDWLVRAVQPNGGDVTVRLTPEDYQEDRLNARALNRRFPSSYIVKAGKWPMVIEAMRVFSQGRTKHRTSYAVTGWAADRDAFILPSLSGAITATGLDDTIIYENPDAVSRIRAYGVNVREPEQKIDDAVRALIESIPPKVMIPLLTQVLAAPLTSLGIGKDKTVLHLFGKTGSYKTSLIKVVLALYGQFHEDPVIDSWTATTASIEIPAHQYRDLPLAVDDYKVSALRRGEENKAISFVQSYADNTARGRMSANQRERPRLVARCLLITTGEDVWESHQSALARTLVVEVARDEIEFSAVTHLAALAEAGRFAELGYLWLRWLCQMGQSTLSVQIPARREHFRRGLNELPIAKEHPRLATAIANLMVASEFFEAFLADTFPTLAEPYREQAKLGWAWALNAATKQAEAARELSPYQQVITALKEAVDFEDVYFIGRRQSDRPWPTIPNKAADAIGYIDPEGVYLTDRVFGWLNERRHREGRSISFSWMAFQQEAEGEHGAVKTNFHVADGKGSPRMLRIPVGEIAPGYITLINELGALGAEARKE